MIRANASGHLERNGMAGQHANGWKYYTNHEPDVIDGPEYFLPLQNYFQFTDSILVIAFDGLGGWREATFRVLHSERGSVITERRQPWERWQITVIGDVVLIDIGGGKFSVIDSATKRTLLAKADEPVARAYANSLNRKAKAFADMTIPELQEAAKARLGHGFKIGTGRDEMIAALTEKAA